MKLSEYARLDGVGMMELCAKGEITHAELRDCAVRAIETLNPTLNFLSGEIQPPSPLPADGVFQGLPVLVKEGHGSVGLPLAQGSRLCAGLTAPRDSEFVRRLKGSGVDVVGATTAPEFGIYHVTESKLHGASLNPWSLKHSPGGSSGGSSAAVSAGIVPVATSSDGGGSIRTPAHCCGVFGLKPSRARTPVGDRADAGLFPFSHYHVTTRSVRDSAAFLDILSGPVAGSRYHTTAPDKGFLASIDKPLESLRIGYTAQSPSLTKLDPDCRSAVLSAVRTCEELGHHVEEASPKYNWHQLIDSFMPAWVHGLPYALEHLERLTGRSCSAETLDQMTLRVRDYAKTITINDLLLADSVFQSVRRSLDEFFNTYDIWITPTAVTPAPRIFDYDPNATDEDAHSYGMRSLHDFSAFTPIFNISGHPAASVPVANTANDLPIGVQLASRLSGERIVLNLAAQLERANPWKHRHPTYSIFT